MHVLCYIRLFAYRALAYGVTRAIYICVCVCVCSKAKKIRLDPILPSVHQYGRHLCR